MLYQGKGDEISINVKKSFDDVRNALTVTEFAKDEQDEMFSIVAAVLHLGNVGFSAEEGVSTIIKPEILEIVSKVWFNLDISGFKKKCFIKTLFIPEFINRRHPGKKYDDPF